MENSIDNRYDFLGHFWYVLVKTLHFMVVADSPQWWNVEVTGRDH